MNSDVVVMEKDGVRAAVDPAKGCGVMGFWVEKSGEWLALMPDASDASLGLKAASFLMVPYSNRIEDGHFSFAGMEYQLENGEGHAIHGDVRGREWTIETSASDRLGCRFRTADQQGVNWPWAFEAYIEYALDGGVFSSTLTLLNKGETSMPAGFGWHPYFSRRLTKESEPVHLAFRVDSAYPDANNNRIPSGPLQGLQDNQDFLVEKELASDNFLDTCFYGYDGKGYIAWPHSGVRLHFECSEVCRHLILYNPPQPYFAVEPVTNANNGVNLYNQGDASSGVKVLAPGQGMEGRFTLRAEVA
jgi:aldose 1-epimerase